MSESEEVVVSIICNTFNHEQFISDALESFVTQKTEYKFEVLVHDDASTDRTPDLIKIFEEKYPNIIKPIYQKNNQYSQGVKITREIQIPRAKGRYIAFCEGDDCWIGNDKLQRIISFLENHIDYGAVFHATIMKDMVNGKESIMGLKSNKDSDYTFENAIDNECHTSSFVVRKELLIFERPKFFYALKNVGDYPMKIYFTLYSKVFYLNTVMSLYRYKSSLDSYSTKVETRYRNTKRIKYWTIVDHLKMIDAVMKYARKDLVPFLKEKRYQTSLSLQSATKNPFAYNKPYYYAIYIKHAIKHFFHF